MPDITFSADGIQNLLANLKVNKASVPDHIPPYILKECAYEISPILQTIYTQSLNTGTLPSNWLTANICPVFKKGNHATA